MRTVLNKLIYFLSVLNILLSGPDCRASENSYNKLIEMGIS